MSIPLGGLVLKQRVLKFLAVSIFLLTGLSQTGMARTTRDFPQLLTYRGLMSLSPAKRRAYVEEVRKILADFQKSMDRKLSQREVAEIDEIHRQLNLFELLLPTAHAEASLAGKLIPRLKQETTGRRWSCSDADPSLEFNLDLGTCVLGGSKDRGFCPSGFKYGRVKSSRPNGPLAIGYCVPDDSWNALSEVRREGLKRGDAPRLSDIYQMYDRSDGPKKILSPEMVIPNVDQEVKDLATIGRPRELNEGETKAAINKAAAAGAAQLALPKEAPAMNPASTEEEKKEGEDKFQGACQPAFKCEDITDKEKKDLRSQLRGDLCIAGGNFSTYKGGKPRPGGCLTMRNWPSDSNKKLSCTGAGKAMCNPFLYCLDNEKKPFCFKPTQSFTADCEKAGNAVQCDPARIKGLGFQEEWTALRDKFSIVVGEKCLMQKGGAQPAPEDLAFQKFFCSECQAITDRLYGANFKTVGNGCGVAKVDAPGAGAAGQPAKSATGVNPIANPESPATK